MSWGQIEQDQAGRSFSGVTQGASTIGQSADPTRDWFASPKTTDTAIGAGLTWKPEGKPYDGGVQYLYNEGVTATSLSANSGLTAPPRPPGRCGSGH